MLENCVIKSIVGSAGSGKSSYAKKLSDLLRANYIEVSSVVKGLLHETDRSKLREQAITLYPSQVFGGIVMLLDPSRINIISGVRQQEIHDLLRKVTGSLEVILISCDPVTCINRIMGRDGIPREEATRLSELDSKLGIEEVLANFDTVIYSELLKD